MTSDTIIPVTALIEACFISGIVRQYNEHVEAAELTRILAYRHKGLA